MIFSQSIDWHIQSRFQPQWQDQSSIFTLELSVSETRHTGYYLPPGSLSKIFTHLPLQHPAGLGAPCVCLLVSIFCKKFILLSVQPRYMRTYVTHQLPVDCLQSTCDEEQDT